MKSLVVMIMMCVGLVELAHAHNPAKATFEFFLSSEGASVRMEFAWTLRSALIGQFPYLEGRHITQEDFVGCLEEYIMDHLVIKTGHEALELDYDYSVPGNHNHSYLFIFKILNWDNSVEELTVECDALKEVYTKQENSIIVHQGGNTGTCKIDRHSEMCRFNLSREISEVS